MSFQTTSSIDYEITLQHDIINDWSPKARWLQAYCFSN